jgi:hypothetical protein
MEGEFYALVWGIMHFRYLYCNHFTFRIDHKLLKCLATIYNAYGRRGRWINTLHDFRFKMIHRTWFKYTNVDVLSRNLMVVAKLDEDVVNEIQDCKLLQYIWK